jgi:uncharacterized protein YkwD
MQTQHTGRRFGSGRPPVWLTASVIMLAAAVCVSPAAAQWKGSEAELMAHPAITALHAQQTSHRARNGLPPQVLNGELCRAAQEWSEYMAKTGRFDHSPYSVAENIAVGQESAAAALAGWVNSRGHNANLLSGARQVGFGVAATAGGTRYYTSLHGTGFKVHRGRPGQ